MRVEVQNASDEALDIIAKSKNREEASTKLSEWADLSENHPLIIDCIRNYTKIKNANAWRTSPLMKALS